VVSPSPSDRHPSLLTINDIVINIIIALIKQGHNAKQYIKQNLVDRGGSVRSACYRGSLATFEKIGHRMGDQNLLSRSLPRFERHVCLRLHLQSLAPTPIPRYVGVRHVAGRKNNSRIFITTPCYDKECTGSTEWDKDR
jgi:hypothetical protein